MKKILLYISLCLVSYSLSAQDLGDITISVNQHATVIFRDAILPQGDIILSNPGNMLHSTENTLIYEYFGLIVNRKMLSIKAQKPFIEPRTITVVLNNGEVYTGYVKYSDKISKTRYDFSNEKRKVADIQQEELYKARLYDVLEIPSAYKDQGALINKVYFRFSNIINDDKFSYVRIDIINKSGSTFYPDGTTFRYDDGMKRKSQSDKIENVNWLDPKYEVIPKKVEAYSEAKIGFVIPLYSTTEKGELHIKIFERTGNRECIIKIKAKELAQIKSYGEI